MKMSESKNHFANKQPNSVCFNKVLDFTPYAGEEMLFQGSLDERMDDFQEKRELELYEDFRILPSVGLLSHKYPDKYPYRKIK